MIINFVFECKGIANNTNTINLCSRVAANEVSTEQSTEICVFCQSAIGVSAECGDLIQHTHKLTIDKTNQHDHHYQSYNVVGSVLDNLFNSTRSSVLNFHYLYKNGQCSDCGVFWRFAIGVNYSCLNCIFHAIQLRIIFHGESQCNLTTNYIDLLLVFMSEITQKKQVKQLAETKYDELRELVMLRDKKHKKLIAHYHSTVNESGFRRLSQNPLCCKFCQSVNLKIEDGNQLSIESGGTQTNAQIVPINYTSIYVEV